MPSMRQVFVYPGEDGFWVSQCPSLPGCVTQGKSREEALKNMKEAIQSYIALWKKTICLIPKNDLKRSWP